MYMIFHSEIIESNHINEEIETLKAEGIGYLVKNNKLYAEMGNNWMQVKNEYMGGTAYELYFE